MIMSVLCGQVDSCTGTVMNIIDQHELINIPISFSPPPLIVHSGISFQVRRTSLLSITDEKRLAPS